MTREELDTMWHKALVASVHDGEIYARYHFAELVAKAEREACAAIVDPSEEHRRDAVWGYVGGQEGVELRDELAAVIRARDEV